MSYLLCVYTPPTHTSTPRHRQARVTTSERNVSQPTSPSDSKNKGVTRSIFIIIVMREGGGGGGGGGEWERFPGKAASSGTGEPSALPTRTPSTDIICTLPSEGAEQQAGASRQTLKAVSKWMRVCVGEREREIDREKEEGRERENVVGFYGYITYLQFLSQKDSM